MERKLRWAGHIARMRNRSGALVGQPEGRRPLGRPRRRWEDNFKMDLRDRSGSGQGLVVGFCECGYEPSGFIKCGEFLD
jgi:hypothetical protein